jgi:hypothetical protein
MAASSQEEVHQSSHPTLTADNMIRLCAGPQSNALRAQAEPMRASDLTFSAPNIPPRLPSLAALEEVHLPPYLQLDAEQLASDRALYARAQLQRHHLVTQLKKDRWHGRWQRPERDSSNPTLHVRCAPNFQALAVPHAPRVHVQAMPPPGRYDLCLLTSPNPQCFRYRTTIASSACLRARSSAPISGRC